MSSNLAADRHIANLVARYAELVDDGDFAGLGALFADASFTGSSAPATGSHAVRTMFENPVITYADGTPRTKHVTTNLIIDVDEEAGTAPLARTSPCCSRSTDTHPRSSRRAVTETVSGGMTGNGGPAPDVLGIGKVPLDQVDQQSADLG